MKKSKWVCSVLLLCTVLLLTTPSHAAKSGSLNADFELTSSDTDATWTASGTSITTGDISPSKTTSLTIKNTKYDEAYLSFAYSYNIVSGGSTSSFSIAFSNGDTGVSKSVKNSRGSKSDSGNGTYSDVKLGRDDTVTISVTTGSSQWLGASGSANISLTDIQFIPKISVTATFATATGGSYTVTNKDGNAVAAGASNTQLSTEPYTVTATEVSGYTFVDWYDETHDKTLATTANCSLYVGETATVYPRFAKTGTPIFGVGDQRFVDLNAANKCAKGGTYGATIVLLNDATLPSGAYTISDGVTLLIPNDSTNTLYTTEPVVEYGGYSCSQFRKLTLLENTTITVHGAISIGGKYATIYEGNPGCIFGGYGHIEMKTNSSIELMDGATLYAWGFISGEGSVTANSGATVYEFYQIGDYRGGSKTLGATLKSVFPFSQYYIQNIEVSLTLKSGATENAYTGVYLTTSSEVSTSSFVFVGDSGMFRVGEGGSFTKKYDASNDRQVFILNGSTTLSSISLTFAGYKLNTEDYYLPITNNVRVEVESGVLTVSQNAELLAGVEVYIAKGAELAIKDKISVILYDSEEWVGKGYAWQNKDFQPVVNTIAKHKTRTVDDLKDAEIDVNGTLTTPTIGTNKGGFYTTSGGANITSSAGTGRVVMGGDAGKITSTKQVTGYSDSTLGSINANTATITVNPAWLKNENATTDAGAYTQTSGASAGDVFYYCKTKCGGVWHKVGAVNVAEVNSAEYTTLTEAVSNAGGNTVTMLHDTTEGTIDMGGLVLDLAGCAVNADLTGSFSGMDSTSSVQDSVKGYFEPTGKITGKADSVAKTYQTAETGAFNRYVAITNGNTTTFHRFNISVTGFEVLLSKQADGNYAATIFYSAVARGDETVKGAVEEYGFKFTDSTDVDKRYTSTEPITFDKEFESTIGWGGIVDESNVKTEYGATAYLTFANGGEQESVGQSHSLFELLAIAYNSNSLSTGKGYDAKAILNQAMASLGTDINTEWLTKTNQNNQTSAA